MRIPEYLSPSGLKVFEKNRDEFYIRYLADERPARPAQTEPMAVGSAFDAYVKSLLHYKLFGNYGDNNQYEKDALFEAQVEPQNRDFARVAGDHVFKCYSYSGALSDMMFELGKAAGPPRFEFDIKGFIHSEIGAIPLLGKPDIFFINQYGARVIWDWKVNGYCGKSAVSPTKGYIICRDSWSTLERKASRNVNLPHKSAVVEDHLGIKINTSMYMEDCNSEWADQLSIYAWLLGEEIGSEQLIVGIDQIVSTGKQEKREPFLRIASHRTKVSSDYQFTLQDRLNYAWSCILSGHIFTELTKEENDLKIKELNDIAKSLSSDDPVTKFVNQESRPL